MILSNPLSLVNPTSNVILGCIHSIPGNLLQKNNNKGTYIYEDYQWLDKVLDAGFKVQSTKNRLKSYSPVHLIFGRDIILLIKHTSNSELICHKTKVQINKDNIHKNSKLIYYNYKVKDKVILNNISSYKYETPYTGPFR